MKKILLFAAAAAVAMTSCLKGVDVKEKDASKLALLKIQVVGGGAQSRAIEEAGLTADNTIDLENGFVFLVDALDNVLDVSCALETDKTQEIADVPASARVFIVANIPAGEGAVEDFETLDDVKAYGESVTEITDYTKVPLMNKSGEPVAIDPTSVNLTDMTATVTVQISPAVARLEIAKVTGNYYVESPIVDADDSGTKNTVTGFKVAGVYLDKYWRSFNFDQATGGTDLRDQGSSTDFTEILSDKMGDATTAVTATNSGDGEHYVAETSGKVWAYNVAANALPRIIIRLTDVTYKNDAGVAKGPVDEVYLTVFGYKYDGGSAVTAFERGKIHRISNIPFSYTDWEVTPNPDNLVLTATVDVVDWEDVDIEPVFKED